MNQGLFVGLIYNAALLMALGIVFDSITLRNLHNTFWAKVISGVFLGCIVLAIMLNPFVLKPGVVFDTRSILLCLTAMFFGIIPTVIAAIMALALRMWQGGAGVYMGSAVIIESVFWGYIWKRLHGKWYKPYTFLELYLLGIVTHITMLSLTTLLPSTIRLSIFNSILLPVIVIYPIATVFLGMLMARRIQRRQEKFDLEESEKQFRNLYENAPLSYQSLDNNGNFVTVNKAWLEILGYAKEDVIGKNFAEFLHPDYKEHFAMNFPNFKAAGHIEGVEFVMIKKDGLPLLVSYIGKIVTHEDGSFKQTQCVFTDITEIRKRDSALKSIEWMLSKQYLETGGTSVYGDLTELNTNRLILDSVGKDVLHELVTDYLSLLDTSSAVYEENGDYAMGIFSSGWCNYLDEASRNLCNTEDNITALNSGKWLCHESCWTEISKKAIETGEVVDRECNGGLFLYAVPIRTSAGIIGAIILGYGSPPTDEKKLREIATMYKVEIHELQSKAAQYQTRPPFIIEQAKRKLHSAARIIGEIVERKQTELELERITARQKAILSSVPDIIMQVDINKVYTWANQAGYDFFGDDIIGKEASSSFIREQTTYDFVQPLFDGDDHVIYIESWQKRRDGAERLLAWWCKILRDENGIPSGALSTARDITEQRLAEEELENYFNNALDLFCIADTDGYFRRLNKSWEQTLGYKISDLENTSFIDLIHPDDKAASLDVISTLKEQKEVLNFTNRYRHKDGSYRWIEWRSIPSGKSIYAAARDITDRLADQIAIKESEEKYQSLVESTNSVIVMLDAEGVIKFTNHIASESFNLREKDLIGKSLFDIFPSETAKYQMDLIVDVLKTGESATTESCLIIKEKETWYHTTFCPVLDISGKPYLVVVNATDITHIKEADLALKISEEKYRSLVESSDSEIVMIDENGNFKFVNHKAAKNLGLSEEEVLKKSIFDVFTPQVAETHLQIIRNVIETGEKFQKEAQSSIEDKEVWFHTSACPVFDISGKPNMVIINATDITHIKEADLVIRASEEKYRRLIETANEGIWAVDKDDKTTLVNKQLTEMLGYSETELMGKHIGDFMYPEDRTDNELKMLERRKGKADHYERRFIKRDGSLLWALISSTPLLNDKAEFIGSFAMFTDITSIKHAEQELRESEARFALFMDYLPGGAFISDKNSKALFVNRYLLDAYGPKGGVGSSPLDTFPAEAAAALLMTDRLALERGDSHSEETVIHPDGTIHYNEAIKFAIKRDNADTLLGGIILDITDRKKAEAERNQYAQRLEILHDIDSGILEANSLEQICQSNLEVLHRLLPSFRCSIVVWGESKEEWLLYILEEGVYKTKTLNYNPVDFTDDLSIGNVLYIPNAYEYPNELSEYRQNLVKQGIISQLHIPLIMKGDFFGTLNFGDKVATDYSPQILDTLKEIANQMTVVIQQMHLTKEIAQRADELETKVEERTEQLKTAIKELETFSYSVAHDLRAPLRTIDGFANMLLEDNAEQLDEEGKRKLDVIKGNASKMDILIKELLELARLNPYSMKMKMLKMESIVSEVIDSFLTPEQKASFEIRITDLPSVMADKVLMQQVWQNLIANAIKFTTPKQERTISIGSYQRENDVVFYIKDSGVGFEMQYVDKIFGPFQRLHRASEFEGTGIGLAIVSKIIQRHNGTVWAESELGIGSTFYFTLPNRTE